MIPYRARLGRWAVYAATGIALSVSGQSLGAAAGDYLNGQRAAASSPKVESGHPKHNDLATIHSDAERIATALEAANRYNQSDEQQSDARKALKAQQDTARWAGVMLFIAAFETLVTGAGVVLVGMTLGAARRSAAEAKRSADAAAVSATEMQRTSKSAADTLTHARTSAEQQLRAYVFVHEAQLELKKIKSKGTMVNSVVQISRMPTGRVSYSYRNTGKTPAKNVKVAARAGWIERGAWLDEKNVGPLRLVGPLGPGARFSDDLIPEGPPIHPGNVKARLSSGQYELHLWGRIEYDDEFSEHRRWTTFHCFIGGAVGYDEILHSIEPGNDYR